MKFLFNQNFKHWKKDREKHWKVERYHMSLYNHVQSILWKWSFYQTIYRFHAFLIRKRFKESKNLYMKPQNTKCTQNNSEQKELHWRYYNCRSQSMFKNHNNKYNMVLAQNRHADQWNKTKYPDRTYSMLWAHTVVLGTEWFSPRTVHAVNHLIISPALTRDIINIPEANY